LIHQIIPILKTERSISEQMVYLWPCLFLCFVSAGVGRTGAFIVIDSQLERIRHMTTADIYGQVINK
jgi:protein tyrosine phosphatase